MGAGGSARHDRTAIGPAALPEGQVITSSVPIPAEPSGLHSVAVQPGWAPGSHQLVALPSGQHVTIIVPPTAQPGDRLAVNPNVPAGMAQELSATPEARAEAARWMAAELQQQDQLELDRKLVAAAQKGNDENVGVLLAAGASCDAKSNDGLPALFLAARNGHTAVVAELVQAGANVNAPSGHGSTPLIVAAGSGDATCVDILLRHGADPNAAREDGWTALVAAASWGRMDAAQCLVACGRVQTDTRFQGHTALQWAEEKGHAQIAALLRGAAAAPPASSATAPPAAHAAVVDPAECASVLRAAAALERAHQDEDLELTHPSVIAKKIELYRRGLDMLTTAIHSGTFSPEQLLKKAEVVRSRLLALGVPESELPPGAEVAAEALATVVGMGFAEAEATAALQSCGNDAAQAIEHLLQNAGRREMVDAAQQAAQERRLTRLAREHESGSS